MKGIDLPDGISEVVATTKNGQFNAAPMGLINRRGLFIKMYKNTHTFTNVSNNGLLVANFTWNPLIFVKAAFEDLDNYYFYEDEGAPILKDAYAWIEFKCEVRMKESQKIALIQLAPRRWKVLSRSIRPISRAFNAVIEATILGTRYKALGDIKCLNYINYYEKLIKKCGGSEELDAIMVLQQYLRETAHHNG